MQMSEVAAYTDKRWIDGLLHTSAYLQLIAAHVTGWFDRRFLEIALREAEAALTEGGIPIGACLVRAGEVIGAGHNQRVQSGDPTAHGEISAMRAAGRQRTYRDTVMYSTLMPCHMCAGTIVQFGIPRVVAGESKTFSGAEAFLREHRVAVDVMDDSRCITLMERFIEQHPEIWAEDIGE